MYARHTQKCAPTPRSSMRKNTQQLVLYNIVSYLVRININININSRSEKHKVDVRVQNKYKGENKKDVRIVGPESSTGDANIIKRRFGYHLPGMLQQYNCNGSFFSQSKTRCRIFRSSLYRYNCMYVQQYCCYCCKMPCYNIRQQKIRVLQQIGVYCCALSAGARTYRSAV